MDGEQLVKVNYEISKTAKENLSRLKKEFKIPISSLVDTLLKFDSDAVDKFIEVYKKLNHDSIKRYNYLSVDNGGIVFNSETMKKIVNSNISNLTQEEAVAEGVKNIEKDGTNTKADQDYMDKFFPNDLLDEKELVKEMLIYQKGLLSVHFKTKELEREIQRLKEIIKNK